MWSENLFGLFFTHVAVYFITTWCWHFQCTFCGDTGVQIRCSRKGRILRQQKKRDEKVPVSHSLRVFFSCLTESAVLMQASRQRMFEAAGMITLPRLLIALMQTPTFWTNQSDGSDLYGLGRDRHGGRFSAYHKLLNWTFLLLAEACRVWNDVDRFRPHHCNTRGELWNNKWIQCDIKIHTNSNACC